VVGWMPRSGTLWQLVRVSQVEVSRARASESCVAAHLSSTASACWGSPGEEAMSEVCAVWAAGSASGTEVRNCQGCQGLVCRAGPA